VDSSFAGHCVRVYFITNAILQHSGSKLNNCAQIQDLNWARMSQNISLNECSDSRFSD